MPMDSARCLSVLMGVLTMAWGCIAGDFYVKLPGLKAHRKVPRPTWLGRSWFILAGAALIWMGAGRY
jgi:hypothetical protein